MYIYISALDVLLIVIYIYIYIYRKIKIKVESAWAEDMGQFLYQLNSNSIKNPRNLKK